ncbi:hypothetical protein P171DRAFT_437514 [Karstenula rhodostoma CBS 690.94]|uniref:Mid2 domain-containing protein n=1 Tax=Karstenula rhodostoma CBS 690.94 TaxID=1392251 RepID=A0A9P4U5D8_9PLEO|nr:hypothetical protein P171DRAFT_437514 [Karstenula rhodostoma CBS 690.94]
MLGSIFASSALFASFSVAELLTATREAPDPTITSAPSIPIELLRKQAVGDRFIGWISIDGEWISRSCDIGGTYFQNNDYWKCCAITRNGCNAAVGCVAGSLVYSLYTSSSYSLSTLACTAAYDDPDATSWSVCNTGLMYENTADFDPVTNIFCGASASRFTYYRVRPTESTSSSESSSSTSTPTSTSASPTDTPTNPADSATSTPSPTPLPEPTKPKSKAWIAGAVVGPIVGLALVGLLAWFLLSRRNKKTAPPPPPMQQHYGSPTQPPAYHYDAQKPAAVPMGMAAHQGWAAPPPHSPTSQAAASPPQNLYGQQWQPQPQQAQPQQVYPGPGPSLGQGPPPQNVQTYAVGEEGKPVGVAGYGERPFSAELDGGSRG